jgi:hypothetical protein
MQDNQYTRRWMLKKIKQRQEKEEQRKKELQELYDKK